MLVDFALLGKLGRIGAAVSIETIFVADAVDVRDLKVSHKDDMLKLAYMLKREGCQVEDREQPIDATSITVTCRVCGKAYLHPEFLKDASDGTPIYWQTTEEGVVNFCSCQCGTDWYNQRNNRQ